MDPPRKGPRGAPTLGSHRGTPRCACCSLEKLITIQIIESMATQTYDFIIVGGGIARDTLASRLHEKLPERSYC